MGTDPLLDIYNEFVPVIVSHFRIRGTDPIKDQDAVPAIRVGRK